MGVVMNEIDFGKHFADLKDLQSMMSATTNADSVMAWIKRWRELNESVDNDDWTDKFPSVSDISIVEKDLTIWVEKEIFEGGLMMKMSIQVF
jgi:hypothetical protein